MEPSKTESTFEELKRYVRFTDDDALRLAEFGPHAAPAFQTLAQEFYERIREHEEAHAAFISEDQIRRLQASMVQWMARVFGGTYDAAYFVMTEQLGWAHVRAGLPQRYVVTAMAVLRVSLFTLIDAHAPRAGASIRDALSRLLDIELAIMLESYHMHALARVERARELNGLDRGGQHQIEAIERAPVLVVGIDLKGNVCLFNPAAERMTGWKREEIIGRSFVEVLVPEELRVTLTPAFTRDEVVESWLQTRAGKVRRVDWRLAHVDGATFAFGADVTDEEDERERDQRTKRIAAAGTLVASIAHELRNPLNGAGLHVALLERALAKDGTAETIDAVRVVGSELRRLATLVTDFLDFARPKPLVRAPVDIGELCAKVVAGLPEDPRITIATDFPVQALVVEADADPLEHVVVHLLRNAIEALGTTGGKVVVRARREPRHAWVEVEDDGPGLSDKDAPIFDAFYSTKPDGTGLGLAIVHRVVSDHAGDVDVESRPGCTRFRLRLPLRHEVSES